MLASARSGRGRAPGGVLALQARASSEISDSRHVSPATPASTTWRKVSRAAGGSLPAPQGVSSSSVTGPSLTEATCM